MAEVAAVEQLCSMFSTLPPSCVADVLAECGNDSNKALEKLLQLGETSPQTVNLGVNNDVRKGVSLLLCPRCRALRGLEQQGSAPPASSCCQNAPHCCRRCLPICCPPSTVCVPCRPIRGPQARGGPNRWVPGVGRCRALHDAWLRPLASCCRCLQARVSSPTPSKLALHWVLQDTATPWMDPSFGSFAGSTSSPPAPAITNQSEERYGAGLRRAVTGSGQ